MRSLSSVTNQPSFTTIEFDSTVRPLNKLFILTLKGRSLTVMVEKNLTIGQLKERNRDSFDPPYPAEYDFRLIHCGNYLLDEQLSLNDCLINHEDILYLVHGPRIQNRSFTSDEELPEDRTDRNIQSLEIPQRKLLANILRMGENTQRDSMFMENFLTNLSTLENPIMEEVKGAHDRTDEQELFNQRFWEKLPFLNSSIKYFYS
ncbi:unnamed protein product [Adineta ricciae]|uniref:Ubiquitin-like domain-containing protein n=1 Tax=Adineta ricciae TaxID=249248 RepID=A0A815UUQ0_ADIRI|nr:unnamed protein product [Adineta ricciae]CAF1525657.1 unnamed protein product [Adineta ricciae]